MNRFQNNFACLFSIQKVSYKKFVSIRLRSRSQLKVKILNLPCLECNLYIHQWISRELRTHILLNKYLCHAESLYRYIKGHSHSRRSNDHIDLVRSTTSTFIIGFQNNFAHLFSLTSTSVM